MIRLALRKATGIRPRIDWRRCGHAVGRRVANLVFPPRCLACDEGLDDDCQRPLLCDGCRRSLATSGSRCPRCGMPVEMEGSENAECNSCHGRRLPFERVWVLGEYGSLLRSVVLRMKHAEGEPLSRAVGELLWQARGPEIALWRPDVVASIPMHWLRRLRRGTNSPEILASVLAGGLRVACARELLARRRHTPIQGGLTRPARLLNVRRSLRLGRGVRLGQARVLLVDDVLTTGATSGEAARTLLRAGASAVAVAVAARAEGPDARR